ncbi:MAG: VWA domain-containing protein [Vicinamibacterales bacterium]
MPPFIHVLLIGSLVLVAIAPRAMAQGAGASTTGQEPMVAFRGGVEAVSVTVSVRDGRGRIVKGLKQSDFVVMDSGEGREISDFYAGEAAISLAILLDISGSMAVGGNIDRARDAIEFVLTTLQTPRDESALYTFDSKFQEVVPFTTQLDRIRRVSLEGKPWGTTTLFDSIGETARSVAERANRHRALLVITDGVDTGSQLTAPEVSGLASSIDVPVYLLTVVNPIDHPGGEFEVLTAADRTADSGTLADLARWTGGDMFIASTPAHTAAAVTDLFNELRHQYLITFEPGSRPGWHPLEIRTRKKNLVVHARSGYFAGPARP